jgi:hypothetical protein
MMQTKHTITACSYEQTKHTRTPRKEKPLHSIFMQSDILCGYEINQLNSRPYRVIQTHESAHPVCIGNK